MKSVNLNFLEPSGPLQACNGTALAFHVHFIKNETEENINRISERKSKHAYVAEQL